MLFLKWFPAGITEYIFNLALLPVALEIPAEAGKEYNIPFETIQGQIDSLHDIILFLVILLIISVSSNVFFGVLLWRAHNQTKEALLALKNINLGREAMQGMFSRTGISSSGQDNEEDIEIITRGSA